jgi:hypothetical protein
MKFGTFRTLLALFAPVVVGFATPALGETLISGAIYFDSENTMQEVLKLSGDKDNEALGQLLSAHHVSDKTTEPTPIQLYLAGPNPESPAEFRFINNPTTYWTLTKFISGIRVTPNSAPNPTAFIPVVIPSPTPTLNPTPTPTPTKPIPTPTPRSVVAIREREASDSEDSPPPLRKHHRVREREREHYSLTHPPSNDDEMPNDRKVWHLVDGHWKWYEKRPNLPSTTAIASPVPRALPVQPPPAQ